MINVEQAFHKMLKLSAVTGALSEVPENAAVGRILAENALPHVYSAQLGVGGHLLGGGVGAGAGGLIGLIYNRLQEDKDKRSLLSDILHGGVGGAVVGGLGGELVGARAGTDIGNELVANVTKKLAGDNPPNFDLDIPAERAAAQRVQKVERKTAPDRRAAKELAPVAGMSSRALAPIAIGKLPSSAPDRVSLRDGVLSPEWITELLGRMAGSHEGGK
jgi:hypothetical protein